MGLITENRNYRMKNADFAMLTIKLINALNTDLADLSEYGLTQQKINELEALNEAFMHYPPDNWMRGDIKNMARDKNQILENVKDAIRKMALRCRVKWGNGSLQEKSLGITGYGNFSDENLLFAAGRVHSQMTIFLPELSDEGLTQALLDNLAALNQALETALYNLKNKINERQVRTEERLKLGNEIYDLVTKYCEIGKNFYENTDSTKYKQYIIYHGVKKKSKKTEEEENSENK